jgi:hypothetical protein
MSTIRPVPRPKSEQDLETTSLNVPSAWLKEAADLAAKMSEAAGSPGSLTRSHALRVALRRGLDALTAEYSKGRKRGG